MFKIVIKYDGGKQFNSAFFKWRGHGGLYNWFSFNFVISNNYFIIETKEVGFSKYKKINKIWI